MAAVRHDGDGYADPAGDTARVHTLPLLHLAWVVRCEKRIEPNVPHPLTPIVRAWLDRPRQVSAETKRLDPILPRVILSPVSPARERGGRLLGGLVPDAKPEPLPLLPDARPDPHRVPLLELADASGVQSMARGRGAPLDLRLVVEAVLSVPYEHRATPETRIVWTVGELLTALEPPKPRGGELAAWGRIRRAILEAGERWIPWQDGGRWWLVRVRGIPAERPSDTDTVVLSVALPAGASAGPLIDRAELRAAGRRSAPEYRTLIGVSTLAWRPGRTRLPRAGVGGVWVGDPTRYPVLTAADRRRIAVGEAAKHDQARIDRAIQETAGVEVLDLQAVDEDGRRGWRIVPVEAADAVRKHRGRKG